MNHPLILLTNDDGIFAPGLLALVNALRPLGKLVVVAPDSPQSGQGHAITVEHPLRLKKMSIFGDDVEAYACTGTPVDCVKLAKNIVLHGRKADLCCSGINHGSNSSVSILYSGTMSAAMEASLEKIPSIGFSYADSNTEADFTLVQQWVTTIAQHVLDGIWGKVNLLNVNFPKTKSFHGIRFCRQGQGTWVEKYQKGKDPQGRTYYWLAGEFINQDSGDDTDLWALDNGYISVVPCGHDLTDYAALADIKLR